MTTVNTTADALVEKGDLFLDVFPPETDQDRALALKNLALAEQSWALNVAASPIDWQPLLKFVCAVAKRLLPWLVPLALVAVLLPNGVAWLIVRGCERHARRRRPR